MKTFAKLALIVTALATTACDQYLVDSGLAHGGDQLAPPPPTCSASQDDGVTTILTCTRPHRSRLVAP